MIQSGPQNEIPDRISFICLLKIKCCIDPFVVLQAGEQGPIDFVAVYQAYGVNLGIDVSLGNKAAPSLVAEKSDWRSFEDRIKDEEDPYDLPLVYVGGHQVGGRFFLSQSVFHFRLSNSEPSLRFAFFSESIALNTRGWNSPIVRAWSAGRIRQRYTGLLSDCRYSALIPLTVSTSFVASCGTNAIGVCVIGAEVIANGSANAKL